MLNSLISLCLLLILTTSAVAGPRDQIDPSTMSGKIMCGYQGWFNTLGDGADRGWVHWGRSPMKDGDFTVDLLPDVSEYGSDELCSAGVLAVDSKPIQLFSSNNAKTVDRHFRWLHDYGIDGVFLQRFVIDLHDPKAIRHDDKVLANVRDSAAHHGRVWGLMYDLTGLKPGQANQVIEDFKTLITNGGVTKDPRYIHENGKPIVALWGIGFAGGEEKRSPLNEDGLELIEFLKHDSVFGGNTVLVGVPLTWRDQLSQHDANAIAFEKVLDAADIIQPWSVGSCHTPDDVAHQGQTRWADDMAWCKGHRKLYMPVVYPGFSWHNLRQGKTPIDQIPRLGGKFLWAQYVQAKQLNVSMIYQAMFDEVDEGTAIFKCTNNVPAPAISAFATYGGLPSDFYLKLVGEGSRLMRGEMTADQEGLIK